MGVVKGRCRIVTLVWGRGPGIPILNACGVPTALERVAPDPLAQDPTSFTLLTPNMSDDLAGVCCASLGAMFEICLVGACYDFASFSTSIHH